MSEKPLMLPHVNNERIFRIPFADRMVQYIEHEWQHGREPRYSDARALNEIVELKLWNDQMRIGIPRDDELELKIREGGMIYLAHNRHDLDLRYDPERDVLSWGSEGPTFEKGVLERPWTAKLDRTHARNVIAIIKQYAD